MGNENLFNSLLDRIRVLVEGPDSKESRLDAVCRLLKNSIPEYDWVGFYLVDRTKEKELILGPYAGEPTEHLRIPFGAGICGQAALREETFIVDDVTGETNYLSCSPQVKSEIVIPIFRKGKLVGELDIDSHTPASFSKKDDVFLTEVGKIVSDLL